MAWSHAPVRPCTYICISIYSALSMHSTRRRNWMSDHSAFAWDLAVYFLKPRKLLCADQCGPARTSTGTIAWRRRTLLFKHTRARDVVPPQRTGLGSAIDFTPSSWLVQRAISARGPRHNLGTGRALWSAELPRSRGLIGQLSCQGVRWLFDAIACCTKVWTCFPYFQGRRNRGAGGAAAPPT